ncbi:TatD family deoxyribonuclease [Patescibacteria group bacterium]|nr:MAG: TatD family deoxyribonuclease [Patescibacteria group bacterium]
MLVDAHCHVHFRGYGEEKGDVVRRARDAGVKMITVGTNLATSREALAFAEGQDDVWATVGLHPNHTTASPHHDEEELASAPPTEGERFDADAFRVLASHPKCVAIGECGLDYYRLAGDASEAKARQTAAVRAQFDLATEAGKPVVIHCRDGSTPLTTGAHADQLALIREYVADGKLSRRGVIHCFTGTLEEAQAYVAAGFLISFTGIITFPPKASYLPLGKGEHEGVALSALQRVVQALPLESILVETDSPYLTPIPFRGKQNEPAHVRFVAEKIGQLKNLPFEEVARATTENAHHLFSLS